MTLHAASEQALYCIVAQADADAIGAPIVASCQLFFAARKTGRMAQLSGSRLVLACSCSVYRFMSSMSSGLFSVFLLLKKAGRCSPVARHGRPLL